MNYNEARFKANANHDDGTVPWHNDPSGRPFKSNLDKPLREIAAFGCDRETNGGPVCPHWCGQDKCGVVLQPPAAGVKACPLCDAQPGQEHAPACPRHPSDPMQVRNGPPKRGVEVLRGVIALLREEACYRDDEGEDTDALDDLLKWAERASGVKEGQKP